MDWLFPMAAFLWGAYLVWKVDKLDDQVKELRAASLRLDHQRDLIANLEHRLDQLEGQSERSEKNFDRRLYSLENPPATPAQREATEAALKLVDEQFASDFGITPPLTRP